MSDEVAVHRGCPLVVPLTDLATTDRPLLAIHILLTNQIEIFVFYFCIHSVLVLYFHKFPGGRIWLMRGEDMNVRSYVYLSYRNTNTMF